MPSSHRPRPALVPMIAESNNCPFTYATSECSTRHINGREPGLGGKRLSTTRANRCMSSSM